MIQLPRSPALSCSRPGTARKSARPGDDVLERGAGRGGRGGRTQCVRYVVRTARLEHDRALAERTPEREARDEFRMLDGLHGIHRREVGRARDAERDDARRGRGIAPIIRIRVVGVDDGGGLSLEPRHHLALAARHAVEISEALEVLGARVGDEADGRAREAHELGDIADAVRAHLDHRTAMRGLETHQRHRHADVIVEIAVGRHARAAACENRGGHLLGGGLAVAAAHADDGNRERGAPSGGQLLQRGQRVGHDDLSDAQARHRLLHQRADCAALRRRRDELSPVELRPPERDEQRPGGDRAAVGRYGPVRAIRADERAGDHPRRFLKRALHAATPRIFDAASRSLNRRRDAP